MKNKKRVDTRQVVAIFGDQLDVLKKVADKNYRTLSGQLRMILDEWIKNNPID